MDISQLMISSGVKFGTSGARGLAESMSDEVCYAYTHAFLQHLLESGSINRGDTVAIAGDFRPSSPRIILACSKAIIDAGFTPLNCGFIPTPAVAAYGLEGNIASLMVTGSHIPDDRNGIKFNKPDGEILKLDEEGISAQSVEIPDGLFTADGYFLLSHSLPVEDATARARYVARYLQFFPDMALKGMRIGVYQHSTVARDVMVEVCEGLGAEVIALARSEIFIPVDTEAIRDEDVMLAKDWAREYDFNCIISADGDGDRPLVSDECGRWLRGDVAGILCAQYLSASAVATPVSSNSALEKCGDFSRIERTRIGSPYVIAAMQAMLNEGIAPVVGYEANGGFLTASGITLEGRSLSALPTRDALLVPLAILMLSKQRNFTISELLSELPSRYTYSDRLKDFPTSLSQQRIAEMLPGNFTENKQAIESMLGDSFGGLVSLDRTDGLRLTFDSGDILHLRPSGNAPELRCYSESSTEQQAITINQRCMEILVSWKSNDS